MTVAIDDCRKQAIALRTPAPGILSAMGIFRQPAFRIGPNLTKALSPQFLGANRSPC